MSSEALALSAGEDRGAGVRLHHLPERLLDQRLELAPGPVAVAALPHAVVDVQRRAPARGPRAGARAVSRVRSSGLVTTAASGTGSSRAPTASACPRPISSRWTPGVQPARTPPAFAGVRPCRTRITVAMAPTLRGHGPGADTMDAVIRGVGLYCDGMPRPDGVVPIEVGTSFDDADARILADLWVEAKRGPGPTASSGSACATSSTTSSRAPPRCFGLDQLARRGRAVGRPSAPRWRSTATA